MSILKQKFLVFTFRAILSLKAYSKRHSRIAHGTPVDKKEASFILRQPIPDIYSYISGIGTLRPALSILYRTQFKFRKIKGSRTMEDKIQCMLSVWNFHICFQLLP